jgi:hypothetical protein
MQLPLSSDHARPSRNRSWTNFVFATFTLVLAPLAMACGGPDKQTTTTGGSGGSAGSSSSTGGGGAGGAGGGGGSGGMEGPGAVEEVLKFDWIQGELPEGIAIDGSTAYITFGSTKVIKVDLLTNMRSDYGNVAAPIGVGSPQGIAIDGQKNVFLAVSSADPVQFKPGIYKFPPGGGTALLHAEDVNMSFPRHIAFHTSGAAVVASPVAGRMFVVMPDGTVNSAGVTQILSGDQGSACAYGDGIPYGVSSVAFDGDTFLAANADRASIFEGGLVEDMGKTYAVAGMGPAILGPECPTLGGAESIVIDTLDPGSTPFDVSMIVAARKANKITKARYTGGIEVIADGTNLYEPAAIAIAILGSERYLYIVNSARTTYNTTGIPGLVRMRLGGIK